MDRLRQRGWSVSSNNDTQSNGSNTRPRANTDHSEDTLTAAEKRQLLVDFPEDELIMMHESYDHADIKQSTSDMEESPSGDSNDHSDDSEEDRIALFGDGTDEDGDGCDVEKHELEPAKKRRKVMEKCDLSQYYDVSMERKKALELAKSRMSKWAARLFDPNRPRGLIEAPTVIPLNDEFLKDFGKREKTLDSATGREMDIDHFIDDEQDDENDGAFVSLVSTKKAEKKNDGLKVKIANLAFTTTEESILKICEKNGPVTDIIMPMDSDNSNRSRGRAYVNFEFENDALEFMKKYNDRMFEGRILRVTVAEDKPKRGGDSLGGRTAAGVLSRYWEEDITTKCFRCGQVGHMVDRCPNEALPKPCALCAKVGHDSYSCPLSKICFNCGIPGHINRECKERRGMPRRIVCGNCFISGHHRWECRERFSDIPSYNATCLVCGRRGHFMCKQMRWFFGLNGLSCFNCGQSGHHGSRCERPKVDECMRDNNILVKELERAAAISLSEELEEQRQKLRETHGRDRNRDESKSDNRSRAKSQPPSRFIPQEQKSTYGRIESKQRNDQSIHDHQRGRQIQRGNSEHSSSSRSKSNSNRKTS